MTITSEINHTEYRLRHYKMCVLKVEAVMLVPRVDAAGFPHAEELLLSALECRRASFSPCGTYSPHMCPRSRLVRLSHLPANFGFVQCDWLEDSLANASCIFHKLLVSHYVAITLETNHTDHIFGVESFCVRDAMFSSVWL